MSLADFLITRIAEDERHARKLADTDRRPVLSLAITVNHPRRLLAECEAKRRIVALHTGEHECVGEKYGALDSVLVAEGFMHELDPTLLLLALPYADHPDFQEEWKP